MSQQVHQGLSFQLGATVGAQGLFGYLQGSFGVLDGASLQKLNNSLLVSGHSSDLSDNLSDKFDSFAQMTLSECGFSSFADE